MTIYSWNMFFRNAEPERAFSFIAESAFDVFCLQEVPDSFLERLKTLPVSVAHTTDVVRLFKEPTRNHLVILSRYPIRGEGRVTFPDYWPTLPLRTRFFVRMMRPFHFSKIAERGGFFADIETPAGLVRVFNLHLVLAHPRIRAEEFEAALAERGGAKPIVVCGDFNILEAPHITPLNWLLGGRVSDAALARRERTRIEARFVEHGLENPLRGSRTHALSRSQLDHILVSRSFSIRNAEVIPARFGSDHHPIRVDIA